MSKGGKKGQDFFFKVGIIGCLVYGVVSKTMDKVNTIKGHYLYTW